MPVLLGSLGLDNWFDGIFIIIVLVSEKKMQWQLPDISYGNKMLEFVLATRLVKSETTTPYS